MKKIVTALLLFLLVTGLAFAADKDFFLELTGQVKSGFYYEQEDRDASTTSFARLHNNDGDAGPSEGRIRMGISMAMRNVGIRTQFFANNFSRGISAKERVKTDFAYAYGTLFNGQLKVSAGLLGESPWNTGGPELTRELENSGGAPLMGIRFEWKPTFSPHIRGLNIGVVLNRSDENVPPWPQAKEAFGDIFGESILGIAWDHKYFAFRFAYRLDRDVKSDAALVTGEKFVYRIEERLLWLLVPGLQISANGYCEGINSEGRGAERGSPGYFQNWLYIHYDSMYFNTGVDVSYLDNFVKKTGQLLEIRPFFYYNIIPNHLTAGLLAGMVMGFNGSESYPDIFYNKWYVEPQVKFNISNNFYTALVYRFTSNAYKTPGNFNFYTQWVNIRLCYTL